MRKIISVSNWGWLNPETRGENVEVTLYFTKTTEGNPFLDSEGISHDFNSFRDAYDFIENELVSGGEFYASTNLMEYLFLRELCLNKSFYSEVMDKDSRIRALIDRQEFK